MNKSMRRTSNTARTEQSAARAVETGSGSILGTETDHRTPADRALSCAVRRAVWRAKC